MADTTIALPYNATTSGDQLDASSLLVGAATVKRERMVIGNDTSSHVAVVTTSGALRVSAEITGQPVIITGSVTANLSSNPALTSGIVTLSSAIAISSGLITLSSPIGISSGLITLTGLNTVTLSSNPVTAQVLSLSSGTVTLSSVIGISSGLVTLSSNPVASQIVSLSSGTVTLTNPSTAVTIIGSTGTASVVTSAGSNTVSIVSSGGIFAPVTSSAGLLVNASITGGSGSTAVNIVGSGAAAPVSSSDGLLVSFPNTTVLSLFSTLGAQLVTTANNSISSAPITIFSILFQTTGATPHQVHFFNQSTVPAQGVPSTVLRLFSPAAAGTPTVLVTRTGISFPSGLSFQVNLGGTSTANTTHGSTVVLEYEV